MSATARAVMGLFMLAHGLCQARADSTYPDRPIRCISPFAAGGSTDVLARLIGPKLTARWGQPVVVDNRPGAGGTVGSEIAARAVPDGYTILLTSVSAQAIAPNLYRKLAYHPLRDFAAVTQLAASYDVLVVHPALPIRSVKELVGHARSSPGKISFASGGNGTPAHVAGELFKTMAGIDLTHVPYKGGGPAANAVIAGEVSMSFGSVSTMLPQIKAGRLRALAVTSAKRAAALPDLPAVAEAGVPGFEVSGCYGVLAPARTPKTIVAALNGEIVTALRSADMQERLAALGLEPIGSSPEQFA